MRVQPRRQLLDTWRAVVDASVDDKKWLFGGREERNSIQDAEQLLCLMYPATEIESFKLDDPDQISEDIHAAFLQLGSSRTEVPKLLVRVLTEYMETYTTDSGAPMFSGGSYFRTENGAELSPAQRQLDVVDSYSMSITLTLSTLGFLKVFRSVVKRRDLLAAIDHLAMLTSRRLTAALVGLLRSFTVHVFEPYSDAGSILRRTVNQAKAPESRVIDDLQLRLRHIKAGLRDLTIGSGQIIQEVDLDDPGQLFECGWSWGVVDGAPPVPLTGSDVGPQPTGVAQNRPYLYFTVLALDGIVDLNSERTRLLGLLTEEQQSLANSLQARWDLTQQYWATLASFESGKQWPIEDIPWQTTDGRVSDYYSLLVTSMLAENLRRRPDEQDVERVGRVLEDLATRGRVTRRAVDGDPALALHTGGAEIRLIGSERLGDRLSWRASDYSASLLKRALLLSTLARGNELRGRLRDLADEVWDHLSARRIPEGRYRDLWDRPDLVFTEIEQPPDSPSWYYTQRVVECLVRAANIALGSPPRSDSLAALARDLLAEAEHLLDHELVLGGESSPAMRGKIQRVQASLGRAREISDDQPGTACTLAHEVLRELNGLALARADAVRPW